MVGLGTDESGVGGGSGVKNLAFLYDEMGDVSQRQDNNLGLTENAYYDNDYRLTSTTLNSTQNLAVTYDDTMGNITSRSDVAGGATWTYSSTQKHAVTQAGSSSYQYGYDANGNATTRQGNSIIWSSYNYPTTVNAGSGSTAETVAFSYGPDRKRWQQMYAGNGTSETTNYVGGLMEVVSSGSTTTYRHYIYAGSEPVAVYARSSAGNALNYVLSDHQGSNSDLTNSSGASVVNESFTPFGQRRNPRTWSGAASNSDLTTAAGITRQGYTFQTQLGLWMGMNHMNGRVEDAVTGRVLSSDPSVPDATNAQSYNRYSYVINDPLTLSDATGFSFIPFGPCVIADVPVMQSCAEVFTGFVQSVLDQQAYVAMMRAILNQFTAQKLIEFGLGPTPLTPEELSTVQMETIAPPDFEIAGSGELGATLGAVVAFAVPVAIMAYALSTPPVTVDSAWYNGLNNRIDTGLGKNATPEQKIQSATALLDIADDLMGSYVDMSRVMSGLSQFGINSPMQAQTMADKLLNSIPAGQMPVTLPAAQARFMPGASRTSDAY